jgi:hypothetical protein
MRFRNHIRSNVVGYIAIFLFAMSGTALALDGTNTVFTDDITNGEVKGVDIGTGEVGSVDITNSAIVAADLADDAVNTNKIADGAVRSSDIGNNQVQGVDVLDEDLGSADLGPDSVGSSEIAADAVNGSEIAADVVGSSEIAPNVVGADELDTVHEHFGTATDITDATAHDGSYSLGSATVACGFGEDLLSVSVDWTATGGHNERNTVGVTSIDRTVDPETATVQVNYDGGATTATFQPVATCIF